MLRHPFNCLALGLTIFTLLFFSTLLGCGGHTTTQDGPSLSQQLGQAKQLQDPRARAHALVEVSMKLRGTGDLRGAEQAIDGATAACDEIRDPVSQAKAMNSIAESLGRADYKGEATRILKNVRESSDLIEDKLEKVKVLAHMATIYGKYLDKKSVATANLVGLERMAKEIESVDFQIMAVSEIAMAYHQVGADDDAERSVGEALERARDLSGIGQRITALASLAATYHRVNQPDEAEKIFVEAESLTQQIEENHTRAGSLVNLARQRGSLGQTDIARKLLAEAESFADQVTDQGIKTSLLTTISAAQKSL